MIQLSSYLRKYTVCTECDAMWYSRMLSVFLRNLLLLTPGHGLEKPSHDDGDDKIPPKHWQLSTKLNGVGLQGTVRSSKLSQGETNISQGTSQVYDIYVLWS
jgi:hypothetical protein